MQSRTVSFAVFEDMGLSGTETERDKHSIVFFLGFCRQIGDLSFGKSLH